MALLKTVGNMGSPAYQESLAGRPVRQQFLDERDFNAYYGIDGQTIANPNGSYQNYGGEATAGFFPYNFDAPAWNASMVGGPTTPVPGAAAPAAPAPAPEPTPTPTPTPTPPPAPTTSPTGPAPIKTTAATPGSYTAAGFDSAQRGVSTVGPTPTYNAAQRGSAQAGASGYDATTVGEKGVNKVTGEGYNASTWNAHTIQVKESELSHNILNKMLQENGVYIQNARQAGYDFANDRGLLNSSLAAGAAQKSAIEAAGQFAINDSQIYNQRALAIMDAINRARSENAQATNRAREFTAGAKNTASLANQQAVNTFLAGDRDAVNRAREFGAGAKNTAALSNAEMSNRALSENAAALNKSREFGATQQMQGLLSNQEATNKAFSENAALSQQAAEFNATAANRAGEFNADNATKVSLANAGAMNQAELAEFTAQHDVAMQTIKGEQAAELARIENDSKLLIQTRASAVDLYKQTIQNISTISTTPGITAAQQQAYVDAQVKLTDSGMKLLVGMNNTSLSSSTASGALAGLSMPGGPPMPKS